MEKRNTKQKELIFDILKDDKTHPTIQEIYKKAKVLDQKIGQATVYRNVNTLVEEHKILKLPSTDKDANHYDGNCTPHDHLLCKKCGKIVDLYDNNYNEIIQKISNKHFVKIYKMTVIFEGICGECNEKI